MPTSDYSGGGASFYLSDISPQDKPWDTHRAQADEIAKLYSLVGYDRYFERISDCSQWLTYALKSADDGELKLKLQDARFCRVRHCPVCQWRRSLMWRARFFKTLPKIQEDFPTAKWLFLTLTVRNCPIAELRSTLTDMNSAWTRLSQRKSFPALGFIKSLEVTRGADGSAHPHFHSLLLVPAGYFGGTGYLSQVKWTDLWQKSLRADYTPILNVKLVKPRQPSLNSPLDTSNEAIARAICETLKYSVKPDDLVADPVWLQELTKQLHKTRAIAIGGALRQYLSEDEPEDLINADLQEEQLDDNDFTLLFDWAAVVRRYRSGK